MNPILECYGLTKSYNKMYTALNNLNLTLDRGQIIGLLGPNGSGKTTFIKLLNDVLVPTQGEIRINGMAPGVETKKIVSYLPERTYLDETMKVKEILNNYNEKAAILISTHLIQDIENILDRVLFIKQGQLVLNATVDEIRTEQGKSVDALFREVFRC